MTWVIDRWDRREGAGAVRSEHFAAIEFAASANVDRVVDFVVGEAVVVTLDGPPAAGAIATVRPMRRRQPEGTTWALGVSIAGRYDRSWIHRAGDGVLEIALGSCCGHCTPFPAILRFEGVTSGLEVGGGIEDLIRFASADEVRDRAIDVPAGSTAYCVVEGHGYGPDEKYDFVVARSVSFVEPTTDASRDSED